MKFYLKKNYIDDWVDITDHVNLEDSLPIHDTCDKTFDTVKIKLLTGLLPFPYDHTKEIPPKNYLKISMVDNEQDENESNTFWFRTTDSSCSRITNLGSRDTELWEHVINGVELIYGLSDMTLPSYTITQQKGINYSKYQRSAMKKFEVNTIFSQNGNGVLLPAGSEITSEYKNASTALVAFNYDNTNFRRYIRVFNINEESYIFNALIEWAKTAESNFFNTNLFSTEQKILAAYEDPNTALTPTMLSKTKFKITLRYISPSDTLIKEEVEYVDLGYIGGRLEVDTIDGAARIVSFPAMQVSQIRKLVEKEPTADYVDVIFEIPNNNFDLYNVYRNSIPIQTRINGADNDVFVKTNINSIQFLMTSELLDITGGLDRKTYLYFVEKALFDYNLHKRNKIQLSPSARVLLNSFPAKEGEYSGYTLYELLIRVFENIGYTPYLTKDNYITEIPLLKQSYEIDFDDTHSRDSSKENENFYDKIISNAKNIMSEDDFITERVSLGSNSNEFQELNDGNNAIGFRLTHPIYYATEDVYIYMPSVSFTFNMAGEESVELKSNIGQDYYWKINSRFFEQDIYDSLPNVRYDTKADLLNQLPSSRTNPQALSQHNTIAYKSGTREITRVLNKGNAIPDYDFVTGTIIQGDGEYALIEMLICLAYEYILDNYQYFNESPENIQDIVPNVSLLTVSNAELIITYCAIYEELTYKQTSSNTEKAGLSFEKRVNVSDRVIDYEELENFLDKEMESKGNSITSIIKEYSNIEDTIPTNTQFNNGYVVTTRDLIINNGTIEVEYFLQKDYNIYNNDVGLGVKYERFAVPYDYVQRELLLENHLIFSNTGSSAYLGDPTYISNTFFSDLLWNGLSNYLYALINLNYESETSKQILMKLGILKGKKTLQMVGVFTDNYSAGNSYFLTNSTDPSEAVAISVPYRYTDVEGRVLSIDNLMIGYNYLTNDENIEYHPKLRTDDNEVYFFKKFPRTNYDGVSVNLNRQYLYANEEVLLEKDARESIMINFINYFETENKNEIEVLGIGKINGVGFQDENGTNIFELDLTTAPSLFISGSQVSITMFMPEIIRIRNYSNINGLVLFEREVQSNVEQIRPILRIKNPVFIGNNLRFYIYSSKYGKKGV